METLIYKEVRNVSKHWWLVLITGIVLLCAGFGILVSPERSYLSLCLLFTAGVLLTGCFEVIFAIANYKLHKGWQWTFWAGITDLLIGGYLVGRPIITMDILPFIVGLWMLFKGSLAVRSAFDLRSFGFDDWVSLLIIGGIMAVLAIVFLIDPNFGAMSIVIWTSIAFILTGISRINMSFKLRKFKKELADV